MTSTYDLLKAWRERYITGNEALEMCGLFSMADLAELAIAYHIDNRIEHTSPGMQVASPHEAASFLRG